MLLREWVVLGSVGLVLVGASVAGIYGAANMSSNALSGSQPQLRALYSPQGEVHTAIVDDLTRCLVQYSKIDPSLWGQNGFDTTPLSSLPSARQAQQAQEIRARLETPCLAFGMVASTKGNITTAQGPVSLQQYKEAAQEMGLDVAAAQRWYNQRFSR